MKFLTIVENWLLGSRLRLVVVEAYSNVVRHAHKDQPYLPVLIRLELKDRDIALEVWDYGKGFDLSSYLPPDPTDRQEGGYGWLIMHRLMDKVEYQLEVDGGNCLKLKVSLPEVAQPASQPV